MVNYNNYCQLDKMLKDLVSYSKANNLIQQQSYFSLAIEY